jgi:hypothetical protein
MTTTDAVVAFDVTRNLVEHGSVATSGNLIGNEAYRGSDGRYYSPFGIAQSIWNIPFYLVGRTAARAAGLQTPTATLEKSAVALATVPAVALLAAVCAALLTTAGARHNEATTMGLLLIFATPLWPYSKFGFNQPLCGCILWSAVLAVEWRQRRGTWLAGLLCGVAVLTRHEMLLLIPLLGAYVLIRDRSWRPLAAFLLGTLPGVGLWGALNWWRFGNPLESGYFRDATPQFGSSLYTGAWGLLASGYAGLLLYCPVAVLAVPAYAAFRRRQPMLAALIVTLFAVFFLFYASLGNWTGGRSYGPRYLVPLLPAAVLPLAFWRPNLAVRRLRTAIIVLSVAVQVPGVVVDYSKVRMERAAAGETQAEDMRYTSAPLLLNARASVTAVSTTVRVLVGADPRPGISLAGPDLGAALSFSPDVWWLYLYYLGLVPAWLAMLIPASLAIVGTWALRRSLRAG